VTRNCPHCDRASGHVGVEAQGSRWFRCMSCKVSFLVHLTTGTVLRIGKP
jgi:transposase-like protein